MRSQVFAECLWCRKAIQITIPEDNLPAELLDDDRPFTLETFINTWHGPIPEQEGVDMMHLLDGRHVVIHTDCAVALVCAVATGPDGAKRLQQLRDKDEQDRKKRQT